MFEEVRGAVDAGDPRKVHRAAHSMRGALLNISAGPAAAEAKQLELLGSEDRLAEGAPVLERLRRAVERFLVALALDAGFLRCLGLIAAMFNPFDISIY